MDTNLLDTCKEARCEIEGATSVLDNPIDNCFKMLADNQRNEGLFNEDPKELRKWLREMEHKLENAPTLSEATLLTCAELQNHLAEHSLKISFGNHFKSLRQLTPQQTGEMGEKSAWNGLKMSSSRSYWNCATQSEF
uniref:Uncharacterized protein n=1 Tax=Glossina austeni TaxID=7395 RepID=A0A1A9VYJ4_GLOAU